MPTLDCPGMRADNPLGFLAAIGFLRALDCEFPRCAPRLAWSGDHAVIHTNAPLPNDWADTLAAALKKHAAALIPSRAIIKTDIATFRSEARARLSAAHAASDGWARLAADLQAGFATDALPPDSKDAGVCISAWSFANGGSGKNLLKDIATLIAATDAARLLRAIEGEYDAKSDESLPTVRWEPAELREYAYRTSDPGNSQTPAPATPRLLQVFAALGLSLLPTLTSQSKAVSSGMKETRSDHKTTRSLRWPTWAEPLTSDDLRILISQGDVAHRSLGAMTAYESRRMTVGKNHFFAPSVAVPLA